MVAIPSTPNHDATKYTNLYVINHGHDAYTLMADANVSIHGTQRQLLDWLMHKVNITKATVKYLGDEQPKTYELDALPKFWQPALQLEQTEPNLWNVTTFGRLFSKLNTTDLILWLAKLLPQTWEETER